MVFFVGNSLVSMYAKCGSIDVARHVFDKMPERDVVSWNALIDGLVQNGYDREALTLFDEMLAAGFEPDQVSFTSSLQACGHLGALQQAKWIHDLISQRGLLLNVKISNSLVAMYAKCGSLRVARQLFDCMSRTDLVLWNVMIAGYAQNGYANEGLGTLSANATCKHFAQLYYNGELAPSMFPFSSCGNSWQDVKPNCVTVISVLPACAHLTTLHQGKWIHRYIIKSGFELDVAVETGLVDMYAKCGSIEIARFLFDNMSNRNVISWNAMIAAYIQNAHAGEAMTLFNQMQQVNLKADIVSVVSVVSACANLAALRQDVVSWNTMISGYGMHGQGEDALMLFPQMQQTDINPDYITFICVLSACSHAGLVEKGWEYFECMSRDYCITPKEQHYACMVDLLGRAGCLG
ncbi:hypothetical protein KI387_006609 [Taxus chinensis]|uniref:Pentatricopeptide repeat-containing protein n=1 Tax=Taxus chinensis TaxID=29808 RepID=A0AA38GPA4_TAXCH|nr:hypothetical protein KI387_006609 [Taxus chinensis]